MSCYIPPITTVQIQAGIYYRSSSSVFFAATLFILHIFNLTFFKNKYGGGGRIMVRRRFSIVPEKGTTSGEEEKKASRWNFYWWYTCTSYPTWKNYCATKGLQVRPTPKAISITHFANEEDALRKLSLESVSEIDYRKCAILSKEFKEFSFEHYY